MSDPGVVTLLRFEYRAEASFATASPDPGGAIDLPMSVDGDGNPWIPPTTVAGSLRAHLRRTMGIPAVTDLMGSEAQEAEGGDSTISRLQVNGTVLSSVKKTVRMQTAIDRRTGSARAGSLRTVEAIGAGARLIIYMTVDGVLSDGEQAALIGWRPMIGRSRSLGMGLFEPDSLQMGSLDLSDSNDLARWLGGGGPELHDSVVTTDLDASVATVAAPLLCVRVRVVDGLFSFDTSDGNVASSRTMITGASLKGVFRSRFEYILRSVGTPACQDAQCGNCLACETFGFANSTGAQRSQIAFRDAPISLNGEQLEEKQLDTRTHVAIDRVTGGASRNRLFVERFVPSGTTFDIEIDALADSPKPWIRELLVWVVKDLDDGYVGIGGRTTRGFGTVRVEGGSDHQGRIGVESLEMLRPVTTIVAERGESDV